MKSQQESKDDHIDSTLVSGDVIGNTAYSQRFVLKLLLKFANLDTLKDELQEKSFEDDLCTLWDMTTERDVVLFLQNHDVLHLYNYALPIIDSSRIIEIVLGIIGNMCCQKEVVEMLLNRDNLLTFLIDYVKSDDSLILIQVLRLINSCLFIANDNDIRIWMDVFQKIEFSNTLYFILRNSTNKELLATALENFNNVSTYCNIENHRANFFSQFIKPEAVVSLYDAFTEIYSQKDSCGREEFERILLISLQITLYLVGFDKSQEIYSDNKNVVSHMISGVLSYYENKLNQKEIDADLIDIIDSMNTILNALQITQMCGLDVYFVQSYSMWKTLHDINKSDRNGSSFEDDDKEELQEVTKKLIVPLSTLMCTYMTKCSESYLLTALDEVFEHYDDIVKSVDNELKAFVLDRTSKYRT